MAAALVAAKSLARALPTLATDERRAKRKTCPLDPMLSAHDKAARRRLGWRRPSRYLQAPAARHVPVCAQVIAEPAALVEGLAM